ncbi:MAG: deoxyguanosinetriphosphate triphosphohydrolase [Clostridiales bacterium]
MREDWQILERQWLAPWASFSLESRGRQCPEPECPVRTCYQRDRDRIIHTKAFRRLMHKAQVFLNPKNEHFRTRLTHTLELSQIARTVSRALRLNEDLTEAITLGHDLGHAPFGHAGERALAELSPGFTHNRHSLRIVDHLEREHQGLNLSFEVRDGILYHSGDSGTPGTLEGAVVRMCDRIAYLNHDIDDAVRAGLIQSGDLPPAALYFGGSQSQRINSMVLDVVKESMGKPQVVMSGAATEALGELRQFMFQQVYFHPQKLAEEQQARKIIHTLYAYYVEHAQLLPAEFRRDALSQSVVDYIAGMTDQFAEEHYLSLFPGEKLLF